MREVTQTILHGDPSGVPGNCLQAAVASLLDLGLDDVPHFAQYDDWLERLAGFARAHGYLPIHRQPGTKVPLGIAYGPSLRGVTHAVVTVDGHLVWDPHPSRAGLLSVSGIYAFEPIGKEPGVQPTVGRIVLYQISEQDVAQISASLTGGTWIAARVAAQTLALPQPGTVCTALVVGVADFDVNLKVFLDGPGDFYAPDRVQGERPGQWFWPPRSNGGGV